MKNDYPMTYEEFKKRVVELFLDNADSPEDLEFRKYVLEEDGGYDLIIGEYSNACHNYDRWKDVSSEAANAFTDEGLINQPVRILEMI